MRTLPDLAGFVAVASALSACTPAGERPPVIEFAEVTSPAGTASEEPNLAVDGSGRIHLSWLERTSDSTFALRYSARGDSGWSTPSTIVERADLFVNWADFPSAFVTPGGRVVAHWLQKSGGERFSYDVMLRQSADGGTSWSEPRPLNQDGLPAEHGFVTLFASAADSVEAVWLDGRATVAGGREAGGAMQLANSRIAADGGITTNEMLDTRICDCCQTSAAISSRGPVVVYRDRSVGEIRDIGVVRKVDGAWTEPALVHSDDWNIDGCPVNGPSVTASGELVAVAWFTGARDTAQVKVAFSHDAGATFGTPIRVDGGQPVGRVDVELDGEGRAIVSWLERTAEEGASVLLRAVSEDGGMSAPTVVAASSAARRAGFPRMVRSGDSLVIAWTEPGTPPRIHLASGRLTNPPR